MALMTAEELKQWILRRLGAPFWKVELTCEHLDDCLDEAIRWFVAKKGVIQMMLVEVAPGQTEIPLIDDIDVVTDVASSQVLGTLFPIQDEMGFNQIVVGPSFSYSSYQYSLSDIVQRLQYLELAKRIFNTEFEWAQHGRVLYIGPKQLVGGKILLWYKSRSVTVEQLSEKDYQYVRRYALMVAKEILGRVRSKYPDFPTAGGTTSLDGATLLEEARVEKEQLEEDIKQSGMPMFFVVG